MPELELLSVILQYTAVYLYATLGSLVVQRAGLLNLGIEGFFAIAALVAYACAVQTGSIALSLVLAVLSAIAMNMIFTVLTIHLRLNHIIAGLAVATLGVGLSYSLGSSLVGVPLPPQISLPVINMGGVIVDPFEITALVTAPLLWIMLFKTRLGYEIRAVGEDPHSADALGIDVVKVRYIATVLEGALVGVSACYYILFVQPSWTEGVTLGKGWLAIALAMFSLWHPIYAILGSALIATAESYVDIISRTVGVSGYLLNMLPYALTIGALSVISYFEIKKKRIGIPTALARVYSREERARRYV